MSSYVIMWLCCDVGADLSDPEVDVWHSAEEDIDVVSLDAAARQTGTVGQSALSTT